MSPTPDMTHHISHFFGFCLSIIWQNTANNRRWSPHDCCGTASCNLTRIRLKLRQAVVLGSISLFPFFSFHCLVKLAHTAVFDPSTPQPPTAQRVQRFAQGDFQLLTGFLSSKRWRCPGAECQHRGQMGAPVSTCHPPPPIASPLTPPAAICADLPLAVNSSRAGCGVPACAWQPTTQLCRCCQGKKMATAATARLTSVLPVGTTEQHFARKPVAVILCQWADRHGALSPVWNHQRCSWLVKALENPTQSYTVPPLHNTLSVP